MFLYKTTLFFFGYGAQALKSDAVSQCYAQLGYTVQNKGITLKVWFQFRKDSVFKLKTCCNNVFSEVKQEGATAVSLNSETVV